MEQCCKPIGQSGGTRRSGTRRDASDDHHRCTSIVSDSRSSTIPASDPGVACEPETSRFWIPAGVRRRESSRCDASVPLRDRSVDMPVFAVSSRNAASRSTTPRSAPTSGAHRERFPFPSPAQKSTVPSCSFVGHTRAATRAGSPAEEELCHSVMRLEEWQKKYAPSGRSHWGTYQPMCSVVHMIGTSPLSTLRHLRSASLRLVSIESCAVACEGRVVRSLATFAARAGTVIQLISPPFVRNGSFLSEVLPSEDDRGSCRSSPSVARCLTWRRTFRWVPATSLGG
jgi:hypothetical protein